MPRAAGDAGAGSITPGPVPPVKHPQQRIRRLATTGDESAELLHAKHGPRCRTLDTGQALVTLPDYAIDISSVERRETLAISRSSVLARRDSVKGASIQLK